jgi:hypothetical protein
MSEVDSQDPCRDLPQSVRDQALGSMLISGTLTLAMFEGLADNVDGIPSHGGKTVSNTASQLDVSRIRNL